MKSLIKWTLWQRRFSTFWWSVGAFGLIFLNMVFYPTFKDQAAELQKSFESLPDAAVQLLGGSTDFFSPVGFLNSQIFFLMLPLILGILAISLGSNLIAREEQDKTLEPILAKPVLRSRYLMARALAGLIILSIVTFVGLITTVVTGQLVNLDVAVSRIVLATAACFLLVLSFGAIAFLFTALGRARSLSLGVTTVIALGGYLISSLAGTVSWLETPAKLFPFHYYQSEAILRGTFQWSNIIFFLAVIVIGALISWIGFRRRDIY